MSLILDALRKMELERKAKRHNSAEIRTEVLNYRGTPQPPERSRLLPIVAAFLLISAAAVLIIYYTDARSPKTASVSAPALPVDIPANSPAKQTDPLPQPPAHTAPPVRINRASATVQPAAKAEYIPSPSGNDTKLAVSGIAWQDERALRRAVVNGTLVSEGAEVFGATVIEIRENLVRFSRGGKTFEEILSSGSGR